MEYDDYLNSQYPKDCQKCGCEDWSVNKNPRNICDSCEGDDWYDNYKHKPQKNEG